MASVNSGWIQPNPEVDAFLSCPPQPHLHKEMVDELAPSLLSLLAKQRKSTRNAIELWIKLLPLKGYLLTFKNLRYAPKAKVCRNLLRDLGIDYRWVTYEPEQQATSKDAWRKVINIEEEKLVHRNPPARSGRKASTWLGIEPHFQKIEDAEHDGTNGAQAFRYLLLMADIFSA